jgi:hypothetical protein
MVGEPGEYFSWPNIFPLRTKLRGVLLSDKVGDWERDCESLRKFGKESLANWALIFKEPLPLVGKDPPLELAQSRTDPVPIGVTAGGTCVGFALDTDGSDAAAMLCTETPHDWGTDAATAKFPASGITVE